MVYAGYVMFLWAHTRAASAQCGSVLKALLCAARPRQQDQAIQGPMMQNRNLCNSRYLFSFIAWCYAVCLCPEADGDTSQFGSVIGHITHQCQLERLVPALAITLSAQLAYKICMCMCCVSWDWDWFGGLRRGREMRGIRVQYYAHACTHLNIHTSL